MSRAPGGRRQPILVLFDVDGTLLDGGGAGTLAMNRAFEAVFGVPDAGRGVTFTGRTDPAIFADMARSSGVPPERAAEGMNALEARYLEELPIALAERGARPLPGVRALLEALVAEPGCRLALATGNLAAGAACKLRHVGLDRFFPVGGFGDGHTVRASLLREALERARAHHGVDFAAERSAVVGDAPLDVEAARACGMRVLAVATGRTPPQELAALAPDLLLPDLSDTRRVVAWLLTGRGRPAPGAAAPSEASGWAP